MSTKGRSLLAVGVLLVLGSFVLVGRWYEMKRSAPPPAAATVTVAVTNGGDRGPGTLREALFVADTAAAPANILLKVSRITLETTLPPMANRFGTRVTAAESGAEIDAQHLNGGPVFDVDAQNTSISGIAIRNCSGSGILVRATRFRLTSSTVESCDVAVDVAENAGDISLERNRFTKNRIGVRFAALSRNTVVVKNEFSADTDAGLWAVRSQPELRDAAISVRDNTFSNDRLGVVAGNIALILEHNEFINAREAAVHLVGAGAVVRGNRIRGGASMGIVAENARAAVIDGNELDHLGAYGIMVRGSANTLLRANRIHNCAYGIAFVLGDASGPSTAADNSLIDLQYDGIDIIGDSPVLRHNQVLRAGKSPLHVEDFQPSNGSVVRARPLLQNNTLGTETSVVSAKAGMAVSAK